MRIDRTKRTDRPAYGQTYMTKLVVAFSDFANALKNDISAEYLFGFLAFCFSFRYFHVQFSPKSVFSSSFYFKIVNLILIFLSFPTSSFFVISPPPSISFLQISLYYPFYFHLSSKYPGANGSTNVVSCPKSEHVLFLAASNIGTTWLEDLSGLSGRIEFNP